MSRGSRSRGGAVGGGAVSGASPITGTRAPGADAPPTAGLVTLRGLWQALAGWRAVYLSAVACNVISLTAGTAATVFGAWAVSLAVTGHGPSDLVGPAIVAGALVVVRALAAWWETYLSHDLSFRMLARVRLWIYDAIARISPAGIARRRSGDLLSSSLSDAEALEIFYAHSSIYTLSAWVTTPLIWIVLAIINPLVGLVVLPVLAACVVITVLSRRWAGRHGRESRERIAQLSGLIAEDVGAAREIVGYGLAAQRTAQLLEVDARLSAAQRRNTRRAGAETAVLGVVALLAGLVAAAAAGWQRTSGMPVQQVPVVVMLAGATTVALLQWGAMTRHYGGVHQAADRIAALLNATPPVAGYGDATADAGAPAAVAVQEVSFRWDSIDPEASSRPALSDVMTGIPAGARVAIAGRSGAGKSTLAMLIARFADPGSGRIEVADRLLPDYAREELARVVSLVPQDTALFAESVRDNLLLATDDRVSDETLWAALELAQAEQIVRRMPGGLDAVLTENGGSLSGGERQRLALARTVLHPAAVLILDESVSQLDVLGEREVQDALARVRAGRTTLTIAHRLSTLLYADRILVLDQGRLVGDGRHVELLESCEPYARLVRPQLDAVQ